MDKKRGVAILREIALVKSAVISEEVKKRMLAELERELERAYGVTPVVTNDAADAKRAEKRAGTS